MGKLQTIFVRYSFVLLIAIVLMGCSLKESVKKVWGNSTATLEEETVDGISLVFHCSYQQCFDAILQMANKPLSVNPLNKEKIDLEMFTVFMSDLYANPPHIVVMGVPGSIDTTEVGIFLTRMTSETIRIDVASLSTIAQRKVAEIVFAKLSQVFKSE